MTFFISIILTPLLWFYSILAAVVVFPLLFLALIFSGSCQALLDDSEPDHARDL